jgi:hypothetical protein
MELEQVQRPESRHGRLRDDELDAVTGGLVVPAIIAVQIPLLIPSKPPPAKH